MIKIFKTFGGYIEIPTVESGCWINAIKPSSDEIQRIVQEFHLPQDVVNDILDADERPRVEFEDDFTLVIMRIPIAENSGNVPFHTVPLGIFLSESFTLTLCINDNEVLPINEPSPFRQQYREITDSINFILRLFLRSGNIYLKYLKQINQMTTNIEQDLEYSIKNSEMQKLLRLEKCLVYFITSIKANEIVLAKLRHSKSITTDLNEDLYDDALIENKQALETAQIYSKLQAGMRDAFASFISNNLNVVMKQLTLISIILMIPTLISSVFGMNVPNFMEQWNYAMPIILAGSLVLAIIGVLLFRKRNWF